MQYEAVIGLEVHVELKTASKIFCGCATDFGAEPNSQVCPVCLGLPGSLPVLNEFALTQALRAALALNCQVPEQLIFDRKCYFYPDLPKGYQVSQDQTPLGAHGYLAIDDEAEPRRIGIRRVHLEEDTGKSLHDQLPGASVLDFNRAGIPLVEIVSAPDLHSAAEARAYLTRLRQVLLYTGVSDARMEEGSLRVDCNVSIRPRGRTELGTGVEIKNLNSFRAVARAIDYEINRQSQVLDAGGRVERETRHWDERREVTVPSRQREATGIDHRYVPEPDLPPLPLAKDWIERLRISLPELPAARRRRFIHELGLAPDDVDVLTAEPAVADYFEQVLSVHQDVKTVANWVTGEVLAYLNANGLEMANFPVPPERLGRLLDLVGTGTVSVTAAKEVFEAMCSDGATPDEIIAARGLQQISDEDALLAAARQVIAGNPGPVNDYRNGKQKALGFLVGQLMKATKGRANPQLANQLLRQELEGS